MNAVLTKRPRTSASCPVTPCSHCGAAVPAGLIDRQSEKQFCCRGCHAAYELIHAHGLQDFYLRNQPSGQAVTNGKSLTCYADYDQAAFEALYVTNLSDGQKRVLLGLSGIHCAACIWLLEKLPRIASSVTNAVVNWSRGTIELTWRPETGPLSEIAKTLAGLGYAPTPVRNAAEESATVLENRRQIRNLGVAAALAGNNMLIGATLYFGLLSELGTAIETLMRASSCLLGLISVLGPGRVFFRSAVAAIRTRTPHVDIPVALALCVGTISGLINTIAGRGEIYFDSIGSLVALLLVGRYLQFRQQRQTAQALDLLYRLTPRTARRVTGLEVVETLVDLLQPGDQIEILPGQTVPADARVIEGSSGVDESWLTGESRPALRSPGEMIFAGTHNLNAPIRAEIVRVGRLTRMGRLLELMEAESRMRPPIVEWANRAGVWFVFGVLSVATATFLLWLPNSIDAAVSNMVAVLIVACPCVIALAAPLTLSLAMSRAAGRGILIKSGEVLQRLARPGQIWLDKTGTLTQGRMRLMEWFGDSAAVPLVVALEQKSTHPLAAAFDVEATENLLRLELKPLPEVREVQNDPRGGIAGWVRNNHETPADSNDSTSANSTSVRWSKVLLGNRNLIEAHNVELDDSWLYVAQDFASRGWTALYVAVDGVVAAVAGVGDAIRGDSRVAIADLRSLGWKVGILSGDHEDTVRAVANELDVAPGDADVSVYGDATPEQKVRCIHQSLAHAGSGRKQTVVMVGDGINDSAALAAASVGIAVQGGAEASLVAAPVYLKHGGLSSLIELLHASRQTMRVIHFSLFISILYNMFSVGLATMGLIHPLIAALMMPLSSMTVIILAYTNRAFR